MQNKFERFRSLVGSFGPPSRSNSPSTTARETAPSGLPLKHTLQQLEMLPQLLDSSLTLLQGEPITRQAAFDAIERALFAPYVQLHIAMQHTSEKQPLEDSGVFFMCSSLIRLDVRSFSYLIVILLFSSSWEHYEHIWRLRYIPESGLRRPLR